MFFFVDRMKNLEYYNEHLFPPQMWKYYNTLVYGLDEDTAALFEMEIRGGQFEMRGIQHTDDNNMIRETALLSIFPIKMRSVHHSNDNIKIYYDVNNTYHILSRIHSLWISDVNPLMVRKLLLVFNPQKDNDMNQIQKTIDYIRMMINLEELIFEIDPYYPESELILSQVRNTFKIMSRILKNVLNNGTLKTFGYFSSEYHNIRAPRRIWEDLYHERGQILCDMFFESLRSLPILESKTLTSIYIDGKLITTKHLVSFFKPHTGKNIKTLIISGIIYGTPDAEEWDETLDDEWWAFLKHNTTLNHLMICGEFNIESVINLILCTKSNKNLTSLEFGYSNFIYTDLESTVAKIYSLPNDHPTSYIYPTLHRLLCRDRRDHNIKVGILPFSNDNR